MKKLFLSVLLISTLPLVAACVYHHPNGVPHQHGDFCPPGQAKKGRC